MYPSFNKPDVGTASVDTGSSIRLPSARLIWTLRAICATALCISVYLAWTAFSMGQVFGCSGGSVIDCDHVLTSHWSKVVGVPVSVPAAGLYASLIALLAFARRPGPNHLVQFVWGGMTLGSVMAGLAAVWFIGLQHFALNHYCPYCLVVHSCGIVLAAIMLTSKYCPRALKLKSAAVSLVGILALIGIQAATPKADQFEVVHYAPLVPQSPNENGVIESNGSAGFDAPADVFEPPDGVFEPPAAAETAAAGTVSPETPKSAGEGAKDKGPSVASTLLLIRSSRFLHLTNLFMAVPSSSDEEGQKSDETEKAEDTEPGSEASKNSGTEKNDDSAGAKPVTDTVVTPVVPPAPERRLLTFAGNRFTLDVKQWPLLGKTDAKYVFVEMFDYTCPHCRNTHHAILRAQKQYGDDLAILALPVPLENACNPSATGGGHPGACEFARLAIAVWRIEPGKFQAFHNWMFESQRTQFAARQFAETLVDKERLATELRSGVPGAYIGRHVSLYQKVGSGQVPKLIFTATLMQGEVNSTQTLCDAIKRELAVAQK